MKPRINKINADTLWLYQSLSESSVVPFLTGAGKILNRRFLFNTAVFSFFIFCFLVNVYAQSLHGKITDERGASIADAKVEILDASSKSLQQTITGHEGSFSFQNIASESKKLKITAAGFSEYLAEITGVVDLTIILRPAAVTEEITVTASRTETRLGETPASVVIISDRELSTSAAATLDDALRQVPGFSLFRRSGSRTANPTTNGVSLRGVGASGASRTLVLNDGVPLNDPFGGWVQWGRLPKTAVAQVEVLRGGASNLYGSAALSGVVNVLSKTAEDKTLVSIEASGGNQKTADGSVFLSRRFNRFFVTLSGEAFHNKGYIPLEAVSRGPVDTFAGTKNTSAVLTLEEKFNENLRVFVRAAAFGESRQNGTSLQINRTHIRSFSGGFDWKNEAVGALVTRLFGGTQVFDQTFSSVNDPRTIESLIRIQRVPAQVLGFSTVFSRAFGSKNSFVAGGEAKETRGFSNEIAITANRPTSLIGSGGKERAFGVFAQDFIRFNSRFSVNLSGRIDRWSNENALSATRQLSTNLPTVNVFPDRSETAFSPQVAAQVRLRNNLSLNFSVGRSFRAPTLNELYRAFRVGNVQTLANENLRAEKATNGEAGAIWTSFQQKLFLRGTIFWTEINNPVANVTLTTTPSLITRQRQNLGHNRSRGVEVETESRISKYLTLAAGYLFTDSIVKEFPVNAALVGKQIPQVARQQATFQTRFAYHSGFTLAGQARISGGQFDDDLNQFRLESFFTVDIFASQRLKKGLEIFAAVENVFNNRYSIGRTPLRTLSSPALFRLGLRFNFSRK